MLLPCGEMFMGETERERDGARGNAGKFLLHVSRTKYI